MWEELLENEQKVKKNTKISPVDVIGCWWFKQNLISSLWFYLQ